MNLEQNKFLRFLINPSFMKFQKNKEEKENEIMKRIKRIASLVLAMVMTLAMAIPVMAAPNSHTITITNKKEGHKYAAYQIFDGNLTNEGGSKTLTDIKWGAGFNADKASEFITELKNEASFVIDNKNVFVDAKDAATVAKAMSTDTNVFTDAMNDKFAEIVSKYLKGNGTESGTPVKSGENYVYTISVSQDGYYFVKDSEKIAEGDAATRYILQVVADVNVAAKADAPEINKETAEDLKTLICNNNEANHTHTIECFDPKWVKFNNGAFGDVVPYKVTSKVPAMDGYEKYYFVVEDTLAEGLTFNNDVVVKVGDETLTACVADSHKHDYTQEEGTYHVKVTGQKFEIVFENFIQYKSMDADIEITYTATINTKATIAVTGNKNEVKLIYSNNPNTTDSGTPEEPDYPTPDSPKGETPKSETYTYVTGLKLLKVDEKNKALAGAEFEITATPFNKILVNKTEFVERDGSEGEEAGAVYYLLKDKKYTTTEPNFDADETKNTAKYYDNLDNENNPTRVTKTYKLVNTSGEEVTIGETKTYKAYVNEDGILSITGLSAGEYVIKEVTAPNGYNLLAEPIKINLNWIAPTDVTKGCTWTATRDDGTAENYTGQYAFQVENKKGSLLPSTGGIGTTIFYVVGGILVIGAGILLVTKRRMKAQ